MQPPAMDVTSYQSLAAYPGLEFLLRTNLLPYSGENDSLDRFLSVVHGLEILGSPGEPVLDLAPDLLCLTLVRVG